MLQHAATNYFQNSKFVLKPFWFGYQIAKCLQKMQLSLHPAFEYGHSLQPDRLAFAQWILIDLEPNRAGFSRLKINNVRMSPTSLRSIHCPSYSLFAKKISSWDLVISYSHTAESSFSVSYRERSLAFRRQQLSMSFFLVYHISIPKPCPWLETSTINTYKYSVNTQSIVSIHAKVI